MKIFKKIYKFLSNSFYMFILHFILLILNSIVYAVTKTPFALFAILMFIIGMISNAIALGMESNLYMNWLRKKIEKSIDK